MREFYDKFYAVVQNSRAHALFCERSFGRNLCQHGFSDMQQIEALVQATGMGPGQRVLDLGCGNGLIAEHLARRSGAHVTGLDYIPAAIRQARARTASGIDLLEFVVGDINGLDLPPGSFDVAISIDSLYVSDDLERTVAELATAMRPRGQMALFYAHGREPWTRPEEFDAATLPAERTPLGEALQAAGLAFQARDFTAEEYRLALLRRQVLEELRPQFEAEDIMFIYDNRLGEAQGIAQACELGLHRRYLYHVQI